MYLPAHFNETRTDVLHALMRARPLCTLVTQCDSGLVANHMPVQTLDDPAPLGCIRGHIARANPLWREYRSATERFEVDSANAAREFLRRHGIDEAAIDIVWDAIALHTTPGIPQHKKPEVALVTAGVEMDVLGMGYLDVPDAQREAVVTAHPRGDHFKEQIIHAFHDGFCHKPETTFGTVNDDVLALLDPQFKRANFCSIILSSAWRE